MTSQFKQLLQHDITGQITVNSTHRPLVQNIERTSKVQLYIWESLLTHTHRTYLPMTGTKYYTIL